MLSTCRCLHLCVHIFYPFLNGRLSSWRIDRAQCLADLKACKQTNIPIYSFKEHQRLDETKYLYGAAVILGERIFICFDTANLTANTLVEGIMALNDPTLRALYDLKVCRGDWMKLLMTNLLLCERSLCNATRISCCLGE